MRLCQWSFERMRLKTVKKKQIINYVLLIIAIVGNNLSLLQILIYVFFFFLFFLFSESRFLSYKIIPNFDVPALETLLWWQKAMTLHYAALPTCKRGSYPNQQLENTDETLLMCNIENFANKYHVTQKLTIALD